MVATLASDSFLAPAFSAGCHRGKLPVTSEGGHCTWWGKERGGVALEGGLKASWRDETGDRTLKGIVNSG